MLGEGQVESGLVVLNLGIPPLITAGRAWAEGCWADHKDSEQGLILRVLRRKKRLRWED